MNYSLQHIADRPERHYELLEEAKTFLKEVPTAWDNSKYRRISWTRSKYRSSERGVMVYWKY